MNAGPEMLTLEQLGMYSAKYERGEIDQEKLDWAKCNACPSRGACSFIGTASTMQIMAGGTWTGTSGKRTDAGNKPGSSGICQRSRPSGSKTCNNGTYAPSDIVTMDSF